MIKALNKLGREELYLKVLKDTYEKPAVNIILNKKILEALIKTKIPTVVLPVMVGAIKQEKKSCKPERIV